MTFSSDSYGDGLPGVVPDGGPSVPAAGNPASAAAPASASPTPAAGATTDATATPTPAGEASAPIDGSAPEPTGAETPAGQETPAESAQPFSFAGKTYKSQAEAENFLRTQSGRVDALTKRTADYASLTHAWMEYAKGLEARANGSAPAQGNPGVAKGGPTEQSKPADPNEWLDGLDWEFYGRLAKQEGPEDAAFWLARQLAERQERILDERLNAKFAPIEQDRERHELTTRTQTVFEAVALRTGDDGSYLFPELASEDPAVGQAILDIWKTLPRDLQLTERGVVLAIAEYRLANGGPPRPADAGTANGASRSASQIVREAQRTAAQPVTGSGMPRPADEGVTAEAKVRRSIREAAQPRSSDGRFLGFAE